jgi:hypothetical protein
LKDGVWGFREWESVSGRLVDLAVAPCNRLDASRISTIALAEVLTLRCAVMEMEALPLSRKTEFPPHQAKAANKYFAAHFHTMGQFLL